MHSHAERGNESLKGREVDMPKKLIQLLILLNLCFLLIACNSNSSKKTVLGCGKTQGSFIGEPFDYYERGVSFANCKMWAAAEKDLTEVFKIDASLKDDRYVYIGGGSKFKRNFFPHRELGKVYYAQKRYLNAISELKNSLSTYPTDMAEFYLNKSRKALLSQNKVGFLDNQKPQIKIKFPTPNYLISKPNIEIKGQISDDFLIDNIQIAGTDYQARQRFITNRKVVLLVARKKPVINLKTKISTAQLLKDGGLKIIVTDLSGKQSQVFIPLQFPQQAAPINTALNIVTAPPIPKQKIIITNPSLSLTLDTAPETQEDYAFIQGWAKTAQQFKKLTLNGKNIAFKKNNKKSLYFKIKVPLTHFNENYEFKIKISDSQYQRQQSVFIKRIKSAILSHKERLRMAILPFQCNPSTGIPCHLLGQDQLYQALYQHKLANRFQLEDKAVIDLEFDNKESCNSTYRYNRCRKEIVNALKKEQWDWQKDPIPHTTLRGTIIEKQDPINQNLSTINIVATVRDENCQDCEENDLVEITRYDEFDRSQTDSQQQLDDLTALLSKSFTDAFPLVEAQITQVDRNTITIDLNEEDNIFEKMPILIFRGDKKQCGNARFVEVDDESAEAEADSNVVADCLKSRGIRAVTR